LEDISNSCIVLLCWAKSRVDREKELLQAKTSNSQKNCTRYQEFSGILNADELEVYKEAIIATSFWWDIFSPILKLIPHWSNKRFEKRKEYLKYLVNFWQNNSQRLQNELSLLVTEYDIRIVEEAFLLLNTSLFYHSPYLVNDKLFVKERRWILTINRLNRLNAQEKIQIFRFPDEYSHDNLKVEFLKRFDKEETAKIHANLNDSYYPNIDKQSCIHSSVGDVLHQSQESIQMTGKEVVELVKYLQEKVDWA
jgi:hypothetical protein